MRRIFIAFLDVALQLVIIYLVLTAIVAGTTQQIGKAHRYSLPPDIPTQRGGNWGSPMIIMRIKQENSGWVYYLLDDRVNSIEAVQDSINNSGTEKGKQRIKDKYGPSPIDLESNHFINQNGLRKRLNDYRGERRVRKVYLHVRAQRKCPYKIISALCSDDTLKIDKILVDVNAP